MSFHTGRYIYGQLPVRTVIDKKKQNRAREREREQK